MTDFESPGAADDERYVDPMFESPAEELERDQYGRPLVPPPPDGWVDAGNPKWAKAEKRYGGRRPYQRISTFSSTLDNGAGLAIWKGRHIATQVARRSNEDIAAVLSGLRYQPSDFKAIDSLIEAALERGAAEEASLNANRWGTAAHRFMEKNAPPSMPERIEKDVDAYRKEHERWGLTIVENEVSVANDPLGVYGTLDSLVQLPSPAPECPVWAHHQVEWLDGFDDPRWICTDCPGGRAVDADPPDSGDVLVEDKKTGKLHLLGQGIQLFAYATGMRLDPDTGERTELHPKISHRWAILAHIPLGKAMCQLHSVDLTLAGFDAETAVRAREAHTNEKNLFSPFSLAPKRRGE